MAIIKKTKKDESLTILTVSGVLACDDVLHALEDFYKHDVTPNLLWDFTNADLSQITPKDMEKIIIFTKLKAHLRKNGRTAHLVPKDLSFGLARMYETLSEINKHPIYQNVFRSMDKALSWLETSE